MEALNKTIVNNTQITASGKEIRETDCNDSLECSKIKDAGGQRDEEGDIFITRQLYLVTWFTHNLCLDVLAPRDIALLQAKSKTTPNIVDLGMPYKVQCRKEY